ncbi:hypothetical protein MRX96_039231 [Rhipicephalus microplus]
MRRIGATLHHTVSVQAFHESRRSVVKPFDEPAELPSRCAARTRAGPPRRNAATYPAASGEATAKEAAANSVSLAGRAARRRRQKQCAHFPRPCPSGADEKPSYRKELPPPPPSLRECKPTEEGRSLLRWATSPIPALSRTSKHCVSLSLTPCDWKPEPGTQEEEETTLTSSPHCESTL